MRLICSFIKSKGSLQGEVFCPEARMAEKEQRWKYNLGAKFYIKAGYSSSKRNRTLVTHGNLIPNILM